ncbi:hypothetical protein Glove_34g91 [Diversispora epigaea]|uniref:Cytochrome P450 n=1 Tax=Diversispora epigaea TaxID=1348612 RepID=A0A397JHD2_9GLOM|nr:hypothetical protein Glove_34g91 [Diversispora epigaea]
MKMGLLHLIPRDLKPADIFIAFLFMTFLYILHFYYKHFTRVNPLPGPFPIPLIGSFDIFKGDIDAWFYRLNKEYGHEGVYELTIAGKRQIVITHAEHIESILRHVTRTANDGLLDLFDLDKKGLALNHDYNHWKFNRRIFSPAIMSLTSLNYSPKLSQIENVLFDEMSKYWIDLKQKHEDVIIIDMAAWARRFICDFTSYLTTEKRSNTIHYYHRKLKNEVVTKEMIESEEFIENIKFFVSDNQFAFIPKLIKGLPFIKNRVKRLLDNNHSFYKRLEEIVRKKRKEIEKNINNNDYDFKSKQLDLLTSLIITNTPHDPQPQKNIDPSLSRPMTDAEIRGVLFDAFVIGADTTVNTFCFVLYYVSHNPNVKKKLFEEIKSVFNDDLNRHVTISDLEKLKYCEAIIKEAVRIRPTVSLNTRYCNQPEEVAGYKWPKDMIFIMYSRGINNSSLYWENPEKFIPERHYEPQGVERQQHKNSFLMFGKGPRLCPGRKLAMVELKTLITLVYRKFDVELVDMQAPLNVETSTFTFIKELNIKLIPRELKIHS